MKIYLVKTCTACPEQYDAFLDAPDGPKAGYLRLRHGAFRVDYPDAGDETIYRASPNGDGEFDDDERDYYLRFAVAAIIDRIKNGPKDPKPPPPDVDYEIIDYEDERYPK